jgi:hypothetical protein
VGSGVAPKQRRAVVYLLVDEGKWGVDEKQGGGHPFVGAALWGRTGWLECVAARTVNVQR